MIVLHQSYHIVFHSVAIPLSSCISLFLPKLSKLPRQCYSNGSRNLGNLGSQKEITFIEYIVDDDNVNEEDDDGDDDENDEHGTTTKTMMKNSLNTCRS